MEKKNCMLLLDEQCVIRGVKLVSRKHVQMPADGEARRHVKTTGFILRDKQHCFNVNNSFARYSQVDNRLAIDDVNNNFLTR